MNELSIEMKKSLFEAIENDVVWSVVEETFAKDCIDLKQTKNLAATKKKKKQPI
jgi:hypothetical protein